MRRALVLLSVISLCAGVRAQTEAVETDPTQQVSPAHVELDPAADATDGLTTREASTTNAPSAVQLSDETHIRSESVDLGIKSRTAVYRGNVRLDDPRLHLTCEYLFANIPETGQVDRIVAETNVVITLLDDKGLTNWAYADKAVYTFNATASETNELVELTGSPRIENEEHIMYADTILWDRARNEIRATNQRMGPRRQTPSPTTTNLPPDAVPSGDDEERTVSPDSPPNE